MPTYASYFTAQILFFSFFIRMYVRMPTYAILRNTFCYARALCSLIRVSLCAQDFHVDLFLLSFFHVFFPALQANLPTHAAMCVLPFGNDFSDSEDPVLMQTRTHTLTQGAIKALKRKFAVFFGLLRL